MQAVRGLSADMEDLLSERGRRQARDFFERLLLDCRTGQLAPPPVQAPARPQEAYAPVLAETAKGRGRDVVVVGNNDKAKIWDVESWKAKKKRELSPEQVAETMLLLGL